MISLAYSIMSSTIVRTNALSISKVTYDAICNVDYDFDLAYKAFVVFYNFSISLFNLEKF